MRIDEFGSYTTKSKEKIPENIEAQEVFAETVNNTTLENRDTKQVNTNTVKLYPPLKKIIITSGYGNRKHPVIGGFKFHNGIDLAAAYEDVFCIADGIVKDLGFDNISGNYIIIEHGNIISSYCHLSRIDKIKDQAVKGGTVIGHSGNTGRSTGPHLHFAIKFMNDPIDPLHLLQLAGFTKGR